MMHRAALRVPRAVVGVHAAAAAAAASSVTHSATAAVAARHHAAAAAAVRPTMQHRAFSSLRSIGSRQSVASSTGTALAASSSSAGASRSLHTGRALLGLEEFFRHQQPGKTGRSWKVKDLRQKGWPDLQRLWFVLLKERNMLLTYRHQCRTTREPMEGEHRLRKVRQSMSAIKSVLNERYRWYKERTDQIWVDRQARIRRMRSRIRVKLAKRRSPTPHQKGGVVPGGLKPWQKTNRQKYAYLKPRAEGEAPPTGVFPERMRAARTGHGQAPADLHTKKIKGEKEYV